MPIRTLQLHTRPCRGPEVPVSERGTAVAPSARVRMLAPVLALALVSLSCGRPADARYGDRLFPLVPGAMWDYRTSDANGAVGARTVRVLAGEGGYLVLETRENGVVRRTWVEDAALVLAVREVETGPDDQTIESFFEPGALLGLGRADVNAGQVFERTWTEGPAGTRAEVTARWTVEATGVTLGADAGWFEDVVRIRRSESDGAEATLWYAPGVGLVRSEGDERLELVNWSLP